MSTTQDAPADTRTPAQRHWEQAFSTWASKPNVKPGPMAELLCAIGDLAYAVHNEISEVREQFKALRERVDLLTGDTVPAPTIEALIAEIEAEGWDWSISGYTVSGNRQVHIYDPDDAKLIAIGISADSAVAALQEALDKARQAAQL